MTLAQYLNQKTPVRHPNVSLEPSDYRRGMSYKRGGSKVTHIFIDMMGGTFEYLLMGAAGTLRTVDPDGNPKRLSVFNIKEG
tara:strand:- start:20354 stop:20599 length:246 start_codon:yes stop_codon:yes gene_type:complete